MNHGEGEAYIKELHMDSDSILRILEPKRIKGNVMKTVGICCMFCPFILGLFSNCFAESINIFVEIGIWTSYFVLLTPPFMEYLKKLRELDQNIYISFDGENLYILRSGKGGIFVPPKGKIDLKDEVEKSKLELNEIKNMIDILQLDDEAYKDKIFNM